MSEALPPDISPAPPPDLLPGAPRELTPAAAIERLLGALAPVAIETVDLAHAAGRVLSAPLVADRDSPPCAVSAMDGYAVRLAEIAARRLPVCGEVTPGRAAPALPVAGALRLYTGAPVPAEAQAVIPREEVEEEELAIALRAGSPPPRPGQYIRKRGENLAAGGEVAPAGVAVTAALAAALAAFGAVRVAVHRPVHVAVLVTGDELAEGAAEPAPWQIRDSNGPALAALLQPLPWMRLRPPERVRDDPATLAAAVAGALEESDALLLTGGVSAGRYDYVPEMVQRAGARALFHQLPIRPGKPILAAVGPRGQAILGLPGNPVSVLIAARVFALPALRRVAGFTEPRERPAMVEVSGDDGQTLGLWWYRLVRLAAPGRAVLEPNRGSGDLVAAARSAGFVELAPGARAGGMQAFYPWAGV